MHTNKFVILESKVISTINYLINNWIGIWGEIDYSFGPPIKTNISKFNPQDTPNDSGYYDIFQLDHGTTTTEETITQYQSTGMKAGLVFSFGHKKEKCPCDNIVTYDHLVANVPKTKDDLITKSNPENHPPENNDSTNNKQDSTTCENLKARVEKVSNADSVYYKLYIENKYTGGVSSFKPKIFKIIILDNSIIDIDESATRGWSRTPSKFPPGSTNVVWISNKEEIPNEEIKLGNVYFKDAANNQFRILYEWQNKEGKAICSDSISLIAPPYYYDITYDANDNFTEISAKILNVQFNNEYTSNDLLKINIYDTKTSSQILSKNEKSTTVNCVSGQNRISIDLKDYSLTPENVYLLTISDTNISYQFKFKVTDKITNVREK